MLIVNQLIGFGAGSSIRPPTDFANLVCWYRADLGVTDAGGGAVSTWADQSGNGRDLTEATNRPTLVADAGNGRPGIQFDGVNDKLATADFAISQPLHVFIVFKQITWTDLDFIYCFDNDTVAGPRSYQTTSSPQIGMRSSLNNVNLTGSEIPTGTIALLAHFYNGASSTAQVNNNTVIGPANAETGSVDGLTLASYGGGANFANITICEFFAYSSEKTGDDLTAIKNYVYAQQGITP